MSSVFPVEIYELIIELSPIGEPQQSAKSTLARSYSLVSRAWRPRSRALLFRKINFLYTRAPKMYKYGFWCRDNPQFAKLIEEVYILRGCDLEWESSAELFPTAVGRFLPHLRLMQVRQDNYLRCYPGLHPALSTAPRQLPSVTTLRLAYFSFHYMSDFCTVLSRFPNLKALHLKYTYWLPPYRFTAKPKPCTIWPKYPNMVPTRLEELRIELDCLPEGDFNVCACHLLYHWYSGTMWLWTNSSE